MEQTAAALRGQAEWCRRLGSPLYATLLERAAADVEAGGICLEVLGPHADEPHSLLPLRFLGATHRLVLDGRAPELARHYPSAGGEPGADLWDVFLHTLDQNRAAIERWIDNPVQTNEVGRSAALLGGFLVVAEDTGLDLRLLEVGASAGLNLRWDFYGYESGDRAWGPEDSPVRLTGVFAGDSPPPLDLVPRVVERSGCDLRPLDPNSAEDRLTLLSYVWPDQTERLELLRQALGIAHRVSARVDAASATDWLAWKLVAPADGVATVVFHSIVTPYLGETVRQQLVALVEAAGHRATERAPLAWLRFEPGGEQAEVRLTIWPEGAERLIATARYHGRPVHWLHH